MRPLRERVEQPCARNLPFAFDRRERHVEDLARLLQRQAAEEAQLRDAALSGIERSQAFERGIQVQDVDVERIGHCESGIERHPREQTGPLCGAVRARLIDEDSAHHLGGDAEELRTVAPGDPPLIDQPKICLVNERGRLEAVAGTFAPKTGGGAPTELVIHERHQAIARGKIALAPGLEELRHLVVGRAHLARDSVVEACAGQGPMSKIGGSSRVKQRRSLMKRSFVCAVALSVCSACSPGSGPTSPSLTSPSTGLSANESPGAESSAGSRSKSTTSPTVVSNPVNYRAHLSGDQVVPPRDTLAQGEAVLEVSPDGTAITYRVMASNVENVTAAHIHLGVPGSVGPLTALLFGPVPAAGDRTDGVLATGTITAANLFGPLAGQPLSALIDAIDAGRVYVDIPTNDGVPPLNTGAGDFVGGEVRGQLH